MPFNPESRSGVFMQRVSLLYTAVICVLLTATASPAAEVGLRNGDSLTGTVMEMSQGRLVLQTEYAGEVRIQWDTVQRLQTEEQLRVELVNGTVLFGRSQPEQPGRLQLLAEQLETPLSIPLERIASINEEPEEEPAVRLKGRVNAGLNVSRGNTERESYHGDAEFVARTEKNRYTLGLEYNREQSEDEVTENNYLGYAKYDHFFSDKWYSYVNTLFERDEFRDLNLRSTAGLGAGYQFIESELTNLSLETGVSYVNSDYDQDEDESTTTGRWAVNLDRFLLDSLLQFFHFHEGYVGFEDTETFFIRSRTGFRLPLRYGFTATAQVNYDWDNSPAAGDENDDIKYIFSLGYQFE
jgi:putative salt-induced outer membrane protein YdiY